jgi:hypothetical protein
MRTMAQVAKGRGLHKGGMSLRTLPETDAECNIKMSNVSGIVNSYTCSKTFFTDFV